ncbi:hypothetical protein [Maribellus mangrovi]|uniref:hypothetical protein n=1 Tax=Maribellus mangrovi TaxID=3133146 RepID=UPI0030EB8B12
MKPFKLFFLFIILTFFSCVRLPVQTITLTETLIEESSRMHELNLLLINKMFEEKRERIDDFITLKYIPEYLENFQDNVPEEIDYEEEFMVMVQSIIPVITERRNMMQSALETQRIKIITKLNNDYKEFENASSKLKSLIESGVNVNQQRIAAFEDIKNLTNNKIDLNQLENEIDKFIVKGGEISNNINELDSTINSILNN